MKKWLITIKAEDEASALVYLDMVKSSFKAAVIMGEPMNHCVMEDPDKGEKTVCTREGRWSDNEWKIDKSAPWFVQWFERYKMFKHD
jgi:hypothetical protein